jgi:Na+-transporting methylmalonyl-CoA/oxaloacetate decarboxylase gamma subunit
MNVDWGFAAQVGGVGFGMVFVLLCLLAAIIWLTGVVVSRTVASESEEATSKKGR